MCPHVGIHVCVCVCTHRTVHHCCPRNRCRRHSATGCEYSSHFGSETRPPRTLWELQREKDGGRLQRTNNEYATKAKSRYWTRIKEEAAVSELWGHYIRSCSDTRETVTFHVMLRAKSWEKRDIFLSKNKPNSPKDAGLELKNSQTEYPVVHSRHKRRLIDSDCDAVKGEGRIKLYWPCRRGCLHGHWSVKTFAIRTPLFIQQFSQDVYEMLYKNTWNQTT